MDLTEKTEQLALGEAELDFAVELLTWLCHRRIIGSITLRNALLEIRRYQPGAGRGGR